jgi:hypothetical protein
MIERYEAPRSMQAALPPRGTIMSWLRSAFVLAGFVVAIMFSGVGLYSVNANGNVEQVVDGYAVISAKN